MKTIFITIFQGVEAKNILRTGVLTSLLAAPGVRLVFLLGSEARREYFRREFQDPRMIYEVVGYRPAGFLDRLFSRLKFTLLSTATTDLRRRMKFDLDRKHLAYAAGWLANRALARPFVRRFIRWLDATVIADDQFAALFNRYRPSVLLAAHLFDDAEAGLLREARRRGVRTIGFINSWDKLTARSALRLLPDELLTYNDIVKAEAVTHADMPAERIRALGIPQYDRYVAYRPCPRAEFMGRIGISDPSRRLLLYAPMGETFSGSDWDIIDLLRRWQAEGALPADVEFLVRFQPNDAVREEEIQKRPWLRYDRPGVRFSAERGVDWDMREPELRHLADTLFHSSLLICYASSLSVDAAIFGKPVININFEITPSEHMIKSPAQFYAMAHYGNALRTGGIRLVASSGELCAWIRRYLDDPALDQSGRQRLVEEQCGRLDGRAGERIAGAILQNPA